MTPKRMFFIMLGVIVLVLGLCAAGTYFSRKFIIAEGNKLTELKLEQAVLSKRTSALAQAKKDINQFEELELISKSVVPRDKDQARTVLEIVSLAREADIPITGVRFPASELGLITGKNKKVTTDANLTQLTPLTSPKGVYSMDITIETDSEAPIAYQQLLDFLQLLENNRRTAQVTNLNITPNELNRNIVTFSLTLTSYVKP